MGYIKKHFGGLILALPIFSGGTGGATRFTNSLVTNTIRCNNVFKFTYS
jgi:hypothetical protein